MTASLSDTVNLEQLKNQAKDLLKALRAKDPDAGARIRTFHPKFISVSPDALFAARFLLADAQWVIALEHGFASWPKLKREVERRQRERAPSVLPQDEAEREALDTLPLERAVMEGDLDGIRSLLGSRPELMAAVDARGRTVLERAARNAPLDALKVLLESGADASAVNLHNLTWWGPDLARIERLLQHGADAHQLQTHHASGNTTLLHNAAHNGSVGLAQLLLRYGAQDQIEAPLAAGEEGRRKGLTPLQLAAKRGNREVAQVLVAAGARYDAFSAAALGDIATLRELVGAEAQPLRARDSYGNTPLHWAAEAHQLETAHLLLDLRVEVRYGQSIQTIYPMLEERNEFDETPLLLASLRRASHRVDPDSVDHSRRMLFQARMIQLLLGRGASVDAHTAAALGDRELLGRALDADASLVQRANRFGWTPLHWSARNGHTDVVALLLDRGADINAPDAIGCPPLFYAAYPGAHRDVATLLCERGADVNFRNRWGKGLRAYDCSECDVDFRKYGLTA